MMSIFSWMFYLNSLWRHRQVGTDADTNLRQKLHKDVFLFFVCIWFCKNQWNTSHQKWTFAGICSSCYSWHWYPRVRDLKSISTSTQPRRLFHSRNLLLFMQFVVSSTATAAPTRTMSFPRTPQSAAAQMTGAASRRDTVSWFLQCTIAQSTKK